MKNFLLLIDNSNSGKDKEMSLGGQLCLKLVGDKVVEKSKVVPDLVIAASKEKDLQALSISNKKTNSN
jgi:hypothetical protein